MLAVDTLKIADQARIAIHTVLLAQFFQPFASTNKTFEAHHTQNKRKKNALHAHFCIILIYYQTILF